MVAEAATNAAKTATSAFGKVASAGFTALRWGSTLTMGFALVGAAIGPATIGASALGASSILQSYASLSGEGLKAAALGISDGIQHALTWMPK